MKTHVYRASPILWIVGIPILCVGLGFTASAVSHMMSGQPMFLSNGRYSHSTHVATHAEMVQQVIIAAFVVLVGMIFIWGAVTQSVILDMDGVIRINGRVVFRARYEDLAKLDAFGGGSARWYVQAARDGTTARLSVNVYSRADDLTEQLRERSRHLRAD